MAMEKSWRNTVTINLYDKDSKNRQTIYNKILYCNDYLAKLILNPKYESITVRKMGKGIMKKGSLVLNEKDSKHGLDFSRSLSDKLSAKISNLIYGLYQDNLLTF